MPSAPPRTPCTTLSLKIGKWFEAQATGWGVLAIPIVVLVLAVMAALTMWPG